MRTRHEVADVLQAHWPQVERHPHLNSWQLRTLAAIMRCRTQQMGRHVDACSDCGQVRVSYNSCRNRHCPKCQGRKREQWIQAREQELLPVPYFHVVFTLPDTLNQLALCSPRIVYDTLFEVAWQTLLAFACDSRHLGARPGMVAVLHTWGQTLSLHLHLHCIVPGGGLTKNGRWKEARGKGRYLFPVKAMSRVYRAKYVQLLREKMPAVEKELLKSLFQKQWVVYAKRPFSGPGHVVEYLGRYTHKIALSNHRIKEVDEQSVTFSYKDYRQGAKRLELKLQGMEFIHRFALHILPRGFVRIRHYGMLSGTAKGAAIPVIRQQLPEEKKHKQPVRQLEEYNPLQCPCCRKETMVNLQVLAKRGPPQGLRTQRRYREFE